MSHASLEYMQSQQTDVPGERPGTRIRALLARTTPMASGDYSPYWEGRALIDELAVNFDAEAEYDWTPTQCATILES
jgi:hypothetical protein